MIATNSSAHSAWDGDAVLQRETEVPALCGKYRPVGTAWISRIYSFAWVRVQLQTGVLSLLTQTPHLNLRKQTLSICIELQA